MIEEHSKILFGAFILVLLGVVLIQSIGDSVELAKVSSYDILNESLTFSTTTKNVLNESITLTASNTSGITTFDDLTVLTALRNSTDSNNLLGDCNVTLSTGSFKCNNTHATDSKAYADYTYISERYATLSTVEREILSLDAVRNGSGNSDVFTTQCDYISTSGLVNCTNPHYGTGYADYTYEPETYVESSSSRSILTLVVLFFALAILAFAIGYGVKSFQEGKLL